MPKKWTNFFCEGNFAIICQVEIVQDWWKRGYTPRICLQSLKAVPFLQLENFQPELCWTVMHRRFSFQKYSLAAVLGITCCCFGFNGMHTQWGLNCSCPPLQLAITRRMPPVTLAMAWPHARSRCRRPSRREMVVSDFKSSCDITSHGPVLCPVLSSLLSAWTNCSAFFFKAKLNLTHSLPIVNVFPMWKMSSTQEPVPMETFVKDCPFGSVCTVVRYYIKNTCSTGGWGASETTTVKRRLQRGQSTSLQRHTPSQANDCQSPQKWPCQFATWQGNGEKKTSYLKTTWATVVSSGNAGSSDWRTVNPKFLHFAKAFERQVLKKWLAVLCVCRAQAASSSTFNFPFATRKLGLSKHVSFVLREKSKLVDGLKVAVTLTSYRPVTRSAESTTLTMILSTSMTWPGKPKRKKQFK